MTVIGTGDRRPGTGDRKAGGFLRLLVPASCLLVFLAALAVPVFAHGCHRDDIDHEPGVVPPLRQPDPEARP